MDCRKVEFRLKDLQSQLCKGLGLHKKVLSAGYMCQKCPAISDDISVFMNEECPCSFDEGKCPSRTYASSPAARPAADAPECPGARHTPLSIRKRAGRIGGEYLELPHVPRESFEEAAPTKPKAAPTKPEAAPTKPEAGPTKPEAGPTKPEAGPTKPEAGPGKPVPASSMMPDPREPKRVPKQTWVDQTPPAKPAAGASTEPANTYPAENSKAMAKSNAVPNAAPTTVASTPKHKPIARSEVQSALQAAQRELKQLLLLQALENERDHLQKLLLQKAQAAACANNGT